MVTATGPAYVFDNASHHAAEQHRCLAAMLDPLTIEALTGTGVAAGWCCLDVGAGGGSIARWLARRVAPGGRVVATDINPVHLRPGPGLAVLRHDVVRDPLPEAAFDLIHSRLVLTHLPERRTVLDRLVHALRPGGWLVLVDFDIGYGPPLLVPDPRSAALYQAFLDAKTRLLADAGADGTFGRHAATVLREAGLVDIEPVPHIQRLDAAAPGTHLLVHHTRHLRDRLVAAGMTDTQLAEVRALLRDPGFRAASCVIYTVRGRRPG
jgi:SAM-dependent methyltransferase